MKKKVLMAGIAALTIILTACGNVEYVVNGNVVSKEEYDKANEEMKEIELDLTTENINDYIDIVSVGENKWIFTSKLYKDNMIYIYDNFMIYCDCTFIDTNNEKYNKIIGYSSFESILESLDKPIIKDVSGTITFYKGGKAYFDSNTNRKVAEYGTHTSETESERGKYFNEYPY